MELFIEQITYNKNKPDIIVQILLITENQFCTIFHIYLVIKYYLNLNFIFLNNLII